MGTHSSAYLMWAVPLHDFLGHFYREETTTETRYNEKTGEPYEKKFIEEWYDIGGVILDADDPDWIYEMDSGGYFHPLKEIGYEDLSIKTNYWDRNDSPLIGIRITHTNQYSHWAKIVNERDLEESKNRLEEIFNELEYHENPELVLILQVTD